MATNFSAGGRKESPLHFYASTSCSQYHGDTIKDIIKHTDRTVNDLPT